MKTTLERQMETLQNRIVSQACHIAKAADRTLKMLTTDHQLELSELAAAHVQAHDEFLQINEFCSNIICLHAPKASDLRYVLGTLRINEVLNRISSTTFSIARKSPAIDEFRSMNQVVCEMIQTMVQSILDLDAEAARRLVEDQKAVASFKTEINHRLVDLAESQSISATRFSDLVTILRKVKQMANEIVEISYDVLYIRTGQLEADKDTSLNSIRFYSAEVRVS